MPVIDIRVRLPGAKDAEIVAIEPELKAKEAIGVIAEQLGAGNLSRSQLVIAPNEKRNGVIVSPTAIIAELQFNPMEDILELWKRPTMTSVCIYFKESGRDNVRERKQIPLDAGSLLLQMIPTLQRVLDLSNQQFSLQYAESIDADGRVGKTRWLHCSTPLEDQDVDTTKGHILCHPVSKLAKVPEQALRATVKGWMWKRSMKGDRISSKQRRLFVLSDAFLFYFKKEKDSTAAGVIPLDYYVVTRKIQPKKKKYALLLTLSNEPWSSMTSKYKLQAETQDAMEHWVENIKPKCMNAGNQRVFGIDIKEITGRKSNQSRYIPAIVKECIRFVHDNALESVGIFRLSACSSTVEYYKDQYDTGQSVNFIDALDNNVPAALLKCYLRELPEPLFTFGLFNRFEQIFSFPKEERVQQIAAIIADFPPENYATTKFLFQFLGLVAKHEDENKMGPANLATVFGPNLLSSPEGNSVRAFGIVNGLTETIVVSHEEIFQLAEQKNPNLKDIPIPSVSASNSDSRRERAQSLSWSATPNRSRASAGLLNRAATGEKIGIGAERRGGSFGSSAPVGNQRGRGGAPPPPARRGRGRPISTALSNTVTRDQSPRAVSVHPNSPARTKKKDSELSLAELRSQLRVEREERKKLENKVSELLHRIQVLEGNSS